MLFRHRKCKEMEMQQDSHEDLSCMSCYGNHSSCGCDRVRSSIIGIWKQF